MHFFQKNIWMLLKSYIMQIAKKQKSLKKDTLKWTAFLMGSYSQRPAEYPNNGVWLEWRFNLTRRYSLNPRVSTLALLGYCDIQTRR